MLPADTVIKLRAADPAALDAALSALILDAVGARGWPSGAGVGAFDAWFDAELARRGWSDPAERSVLIAGAREQLAWSAALRLISAAAMAATQTALAGGSDINLMGSIGRGEACRFSDHDFLAVAESDAEMLELVGLTGPAGARLAASRTSPVSKTKEDERSDGLRATRWMDDFVTALVHDHSYALPFRGGVRREPDAYLVTVGDFSDRAILEHEDGFVRHGGNLMNSRFALRATASRSEAVIAQVQKIARRGDLASHREVAMRRARERTTDDRRPRHAHGLLSQTWQALLFYLDGVQPPKMPYWAAPLRLDMDAEARNDWAAGIEAVMHGRRVDERLGMPRLVLGAARALVRSVPVRTTAATNGLDAKISARLRRILTDPGL